MVRICPNCRQIISGEEMLGESQPSNCCGLINVIRQFTTMVSAASRMTTASFRGSSSFCSCPKLDYKICQNINSICGSQGFLGTCRMCRPCDVVQYNCSFVHQICFLSGVRRWGESLLSFISSGWRNCSVALLAVIFVLILLPTSTMSSPVPGSSGGNLHRHHKDHNRIHERPAKWINPCRIPSATLPISDADVQTVPDKDIYHHIITQATKAERQAAEFEKDFYREAFGEDRTEFENIGYDWLNDIMEMVNEDLTSHTIKNLPVEETIKKLYKGLQKFAVGLEAIVLDQACYGGTFYQHFNEAEYQLKYVLCELQIAMLEKNIQYEDITREIMGQEFRDIPDRATRNIRDWTIFRDYVKTLKYVQKAFHLYDRQAEAEAMGTTLGS